MVIDKRRIWLLPLLMAFCVSSWGQTLVISGRVLDTSDPKADTPVVGATVEMFTQKNALIQTKLTGQTGYYHFAFDVASAAALTGKEHIRISKSGYSLSPTPLALKTAPAAGTKMALQPDVLMTNDEAIRSNPTYRSAVARNAAEAASAGQQAKANAIYTSIAGLPTASKQLIYASVKAEGGPAYSELMKVDKEFESGDELRGMFKAKLPYTVDVMPRYDATGRLRLSGTVGSKEDMEFVLLQASKMGFESTKIVNDLRVQKLN